MRSNAKTSDTASPKTILIGIIITPRRSRIAFATRNEKYPQIETHRREEYIKDVISELVRTLRKIGAEASRNQSWMLMHNVAGTVGEITIRLMKEKLVTFKRYFEDELLESVIALRYIYCSVGKATSPLIDGIVDQLTLITIQGLVIRREKVVTRSIEALLEMSVHAIGTDSYGYDAPRLASRIAVIGTYALSLKQEAIARECAIHLVRFDSIYMEKSPTPHDRMHIEEMSELYDESQQESLISDKKWLEAYKKVSVDNLQKFKELCEYARKTEKGENTPSK